MKNSVGAAICAIAFCGTAIANEDVDKLIAAMPGDTPIIRDLQELTESAMDSNIEKGARKSKKVARIFFLFDSADRIIHTQVRAGKK